MAILRWGNITGAYPSARPYAGAPSGRRKTSVPQTINRFYIPMPVLEATSKIMRRYGQEQRECYVWWGGYFTPTGDAQVVTALCPDVLTHFGRVHLDNRDLTKLHERLRTLDQVLVIELHTHPPGAGGQNSVDAANPAATYPGFISIIAPDFAAPHLYDLRRTYVYEYLRANQWRQLAPSEIQARFIIEEAFISVSV